MQDIDQQLFRVFTLFFVSAGLFYSLRQGWIIRSDRDGLS